MSTKSLLEFLYKLDTELAKKSRTYRSKHSNKEAHLFSLSKSVLYKQTILQLELMGFETIPFQDKIQKLSDAYFIEVRDYIRGLSKSKKVNYIDPSMTYFKADRFRVLFISDGKRTNIFQLVKDTYSAILNNYVLDLKKLLLKSRSQSTAFGRENLKEVLQAGDFFNLGHHAQTGVFESGLAFATTKALNAINDPYIITWWDKSKANFVIRYKAIMGTTEQIVRVSIESGIDNQLRGASLGPQKNKLKQDLKNYIKKVENNIFYLSGSDSPIKVSRKRTVKNLTDPFKKTKNIKITTEDTKIKESKKTPTVYEKPINIKLGKAKYNVREPGTGRFVSREKAKSPINLLPILNAKLPEYVARNMIAPALVYRTGRFANSVRAIDIQQTPKGMPSIGYTYQKFPYQTFEPGFAQGTPERDPRTLIDKSIREIAAEIQLGRFFTRRI